MSRAAVISAIALLALPAHAQNHRWRGPGDLVWPQGGPNAQLDADLSEARYWWELNRDMLLPPRDPASGPNSAIVVGEVVPALLGAIAGGDDDVAAAALIALAKIARSEPVPLFRDLILSQLQAGGRAKWFCPRRAVAAAFAFGIAADGSEVAVDALRAFALTEWRPSAQRAAAITALGLVAAAHRRGRTQSAVQDALFAAVDEGLLGDAELGVPLVRALGCLLPADEAARGAVRQCLLRARHGADALPPDPRVAAHALTALAQCAANDPCASADVRVLCRAALRDPPRQPIDVVRAAALALGELGEPHDDLDSDDELLLRTWQEHRDAQTRCFAMLALGGRGGTGVRRALVRELPHAGKCLERPWVAMAMLRCAVATARAAADGAPPRDEVAFRNALQRSLGETHDPVALAAEAIALGFCGDGNEPDALSPLLVPSRSREELGGAVCLALALRDRDGSVATIADVVEASRRRPDLLRDAATALAIADPRHAGTLLLPLVDEDPSLACSGAIAAALGATRDACLVAPLCRLLAAMTESTQTRATAAVALGCLCDRQPRPWNAELATMGNYRAATVSLLDPADGALCWW